MNTKQIYLIAALIIVISGAVFLLMNKQLTEPVATITTQPPIISQPIGNFKCENLYDEIENDLDKTNYCRVDSDCDVIMLGGWYVDFGCYHFINKDVDQEQFFTKMDTYKEKCSQMINNCAPAPDAKCVSNKCVYIKEE